MALIACKIALVDFTLLGCLLAFATLLVLLDGAEILVAVGRGDLAQALVVALLEVADNLGAL